MLRLDWGKPLLYLYSQDDPLTDADALTLLVEEKRHRCVGVVAGWDG